MKLGSLFRVGTYLIGLWSLYSGLTAAASYGHAALIERPGEFLGDRDYTSTLFGYAVVPLLFSLMCFGFAGTISRVLLGSVAEEHVETTLGKGPVMRCCIKILALFMLGFYAAPLVATIFELAAVRSGNRAFTDAQVTSDLIANGLGVGFALWLGLRTEQVLVIFFSADERA